MRLNSKDLMDAIYNLNGTFISRVCFVTFNNPSRIHIGLGVGQVDSSKVVWSYNNKVVDLLYPCSSHDCTFYSIIFDRGTYKIELWGASGGYNNNEPSKGGHGAYTVGNITFHKKTNLFLYLGSQGCYLCQKSFNGGGRAPTYPNDGYSASGGGASDIRMISGSWDKSNSLNSRIMVAAGGAGSVYYHRLVQGGHGGAPNGLAGDSAHHPTCSPISLLTLSTGGTETTSGISSIAYQSSVPPSVNGSFGKGGYPMNSWYGSGGGGGYYGGGSGSYVDCHVSSGSGGSSFISTENNKKLNLFVFESTNMISGDKISYFGHGKGRITILPYKPKTIDKSYVSRLFYMAICQNILLLNPYIS